MFAIKHLKRPNTTWLMQISCDLILLEVLISLCFPNVELTREDSNQNHNLVNILSFIKFIG